MYHPIMKKYGFCVCMPVVHKQYTTALLARFHFAPMFCLLVGFSWATVHDPDCLRIYRENVLYDNRFVIQNIHNFVLVTVV